MLPANPAIETAEAVIAAGEIIGFQRDRINQHLERECQHSEIDSGEPDTKITNNGSRDRGRTSGDKSVAQKASHTRLLH